MLTDAASIEKVLGGMVKLSDSVEKFCAVMLDGTTSVDDKKTLQEGIDLVSAGKMRVSALVPPEVM